MYVAKPQLKVVLCYSKVLASLLWPYAVISSTSTTVLYLLVILQSKNAILNNIPSQFTIAKTQVFLCAYTESRASTSLYLYPPHHRLDKTDQYCITERKKEIALGGPTQRLTHQLTWIDPKYIYNSAAALVYINISTVASPLTMSWCRRERDL